MEAERQAEQMKLHPAIYSHHLCAGQPNAQPRKSRQQLARVYQTVTPRFIFNVCKLNGFFLCLRAHNLANGVRATAADTQDAITHIFVSVVEHGLFVSAAAL